MQIVYTIEYTQLRDVYDEIIKYGKSDRTEMFDMWDFENAINKYIYIHNLANKKHMPVLWARFLITLIDRNQIVRDSIGNVVFQQSLIGLPYIESDYLLSKELEEYKRIYDANRYLIEMTDGQKEQVKKWINETK